MFREIVTSVKKGGRRGIPRGNPKGIIQGILGCCARATLLQAVIESGFQSVKIDDLVLSHNRRVRVERAQV
ncbi:hypothetical protein MUP00_05265 [Candidatus Bathyarchaeota archaeon]|nr:hypothetical protein [Candidatus Bathyarchaeota archaeon]